MKHLRQLLGLTAFVLAAVAGSVYAEPVDFTIDPAHTQATFTIRHYFTKVSGRFNELVGKIVYDEKNLLASSVDVTILAKSVFTANERRDADLRSQNFFWADSFPALTFKSTKVVPGEGKKFKVEGNLTMRGVTKLVVLDSELLGVGPANVTGSPLRLVAGFEGTTMVNRKDFNIVWNRALDQGGTLLGDDVSIHLTVEAKAEPKGDKPAAAAKTDK